MKTQISSLQSKQKRISHLGLCDKTMDASVQLLCPRCDEPSASSHNRTDSHSLNTLVIYFKAFPVATGILAHKAFFIAVCASIAEPFQSPDLKGKAHFRQHAIQGKLIYNRNHGTVGATYVSLRLNSMDRLDNTHSAGLLKRILNMVLPQ